MGLWSEVNNFQPFLVTGFVSDNFPLSGKLSILYEIWISHVGILASSEGELLVC